MNFHHHHHKLKNQKTINKKDTLYDSSRVTHIEYLFDLIELFDTNNPKYYLMNYLIWN